MLGFKLKDVSKMGQTSHIISQSTKLEKGWPIARVDFEKKTRLSEILILDVFQTVFSHKKAPWFLYDLVTNHTFISVRR